MIQILTVKDEKTRNEICSKAGLVHKPSLSIIAAFDENDEMECGAIFRYKGTSGDILWLAEHKDFDLLYGLCKAILSIMELRGVETASLPLCYDMLAEALRFQKEGESFTVSLIGYFSCSCSHK